MRQVLQRITRVQSMLTSISGVQKLVYVQMSRLFGHWHQGKRLVITLHILHHILNSINSLQPKPKENDNKQLFSLQEENVGLKKKIQTLEHDLQSAHKLHHSTKNQLEGELLDLKKKLRNTEAKYSNLACTPPKVSLERI